MELKEDLIEKAKKDYIYIKQNQIDSPDFENKCPVNDWRNYVDEYIIEVWHELSQESRIIAIIMGSQQARAEEWD